MRYSSTISTTIISLLAIQLLTPVYVSAFVPACTGAGESSRVATSTFPRPLQFQHVSVCARTTTVTSTTTTAMSIRLWGSSVPQTDTDISTESAPKVDVEALLLYHGAIVIQMTIIGLLFLGLDAIVDQTGIAESIPTWALVPFFYALSLKSRVFNPLNNARPNLKQAMSKNVEDEDEKEPPSRGFGDRIMP
jgi:hypothetical protein